MSPKFPSNPGTCITVHSNSTAHQVITNSSHPAHAHNIHYRSYTMFTRTQSDNVSLHRYEDLPSALHLSHRIYITLF